MRVGGWEGGRHRGCGEGVRVYLSSSAFPSVQRSASPTTGKCSGSTRKSEWRSASWTSVGTREGMSRSPATAVPTVLITNVACNLSAGLSASGISSAATPQETLYNPSMFCAPSLILSCRMALNKSSCSNSISASLSHFTLFCFAPPLTLSCRMALKKRS